MEVGEHVTLLSSHTNMRDPEAVQVRDCAFENDLNELIGSTYINKMHLLFDSPLLKNFIVKCV